MRRISKCIGLLVYLAFPGYAQVWQWSTPVPTVVSPETNDHPRAFLWIPDNCRYVRGVVVGQHNMLEEGIFKHPDFRKTMSQLGFAIVWVTPMINQTFNWNPTATTKRAGIEFQNMMNRQNGQLLKPTKGHATYQLPFLPDADEITFHLSSVFTDTARVRATAAHARRPLRIDRICGPVRKLNDMTFQLSFYRMGFNNPKRSNDIWLLASNDGDCKSIVQQDDFRFPIVNKEGKPQTITFSNMPDQRSGTKSLLPGGVSSAGLPVHYYVKAGPAIVEGNQLVFTPIPPCSLRPVAVTVEAWQYGTSAGGKVQSAAPVKQNFFI